MTEQDKLRSILDSVRGQQDLQPHDGITFCNIAIDRVLGLMGIPRMIAKFLNRPLMANDMVELMQHSPKWAKVDGSRAFELACKGIVVIAGQQLADHGHVACVYPIDMRYSPSWQKNVPMISNVGKRNAIMRASQCFRTEPEYFTPC